YFDLPVRMGYPMGVIGLKEKVQDPAYATAVGLVKLAYRELTLEKRGVSQKGKEKVSENTFNLSSLITRFKSFFKDIM
ncbi:MAG: cell division protein FtsA, partial [Aquificaceae bacterium]